MKNGDPWQGRRSEKSGMDPDDMNNTRTTDTSSRVRANAFSVRLNPARILSPRLDRFAVLPLVGSAPVSNTGATLAGAQ